MAVATSTSPQSLKTEKSYLARLTSTKRRRDTLDGYLFILPVVLGLLIFTIGPMITSFYISFTKYPILRSPEWIGLRNYVNMFTKEPNFWQACKVTVLYAVTAVPLGILGAFLLAMLLNQRVKGMGYFRTSFYIPTIVPAVASAWKWRIAASASFSLTSAIQPAKNSASAMLSPGSKPPLFMAS